MAGTPGSEEPAVTGSDDAVATAREWLARHGVAAPEPEVVQSRRAGSAVGLAAAAKSVAAHPRSQVEGEEDEGGQGVDEQGEGGFVPPAAATGRAGRRQGRGGRGSRSRRPAPEGSGGPADAAADPDADPESLARTIVLRKLAAQARTRHELEKALAAREVPAPVAEGVLNRFEAVGLVDDRAFARDWVASRQQRRHLSGSALRRELTTRGVDREEIEAAVGTIGEDDELGAAEALAEKKFRTMTGLARDVQYRRLAGALARRGFGAGVTARVVGELLDRSAAD